MTDTFFYRRNELRRDNTANHFVNKLKTGAPLQRFNSEIDLPELTRPTGLFLVAAMTFGFSGDRLTVWYGRFPGLDFKFVLLLHTFNCDS